MSPGATGHSIEVSFSFCRVRHVSIPSLWKTSWLFGATPASFTHPFLPPSLLLGFHAWPLAPWAVWGSQLHAGCSHTHAKTPTSVSIPTSLQSSGTALPAALGPLPREDPQVLRSSNRVPGLPGFIPHPPTPLFCPGEEPHPSSGIRKPSPALYLLSLSWLQLSLPGVLTTSEVPGRASAFILSHSQPSPLTLVFTPCHTPMWSAFYCALGAPLLGTHPGLSETLRHNLRLCWPSGLPCPLLASCAPTTLSGRRCLGSDPCPPEALRPPDPVLGLGEADTPTRIPAL